MAAIAAHREQSAAATRSPGPTGAAVQCGRATHDTIAARPAAPTETAAPEQSRTAAAAAGAAGSAWRPLAAVPTVATASDQ